MQPGPSGATAPRESYLEVQGARLYYRELGRGQPLLVLHGGPDFDHQYLLPEMDRLSDDFHLMYYDQRGRGKSASNVLPEHVSLDSEMADVEAVRRHLGREAVVLLGHSWGGLLAMEYTIRHPGHVSHLIVMNTAPASRNDFLWLQEERRRTVPEDLALMRALAATAEYAAGDMAIEAEYYRRHFRTTLSDPEHLERLIRRLRSGWTPEGIRRARAIEERLYDETWFASGYDLLPKLERLRVPTLVLHGEADLIPVACAVHVAEAIPGARLEVLSESGHFSYFDRPDEVHKEITHFCA